MFYYYKKQEILKGKCFCVYQSQTRLSEEEIKEINKNQQNLLADTVIYESSIPFVGYSILDGETLRPATEKELVDLGILKLKDGEILEGTSIKKIERPQPFGYAYEWKSPNWVINNDKLPEGVYYDEEKSKCVVVPKPNGVKMVWNKEKHVYEDKATPEERKNYIGKYIGEDLLMKILSKGCTVTIREKQHNQSLDSRKLLMLSSTGSGLLIANNSKQTINQISWSFNDDGSDTVVLTNEEFKSLSMQCLDFVTKCYAVADILKSQDRLDLTIDDFISELDKQTKTYIR